MLLTENDLWKIILPIILHGVQSLGEEIAVKRAYQPTTQGDGNKPRLVIHRLASRRYGAQGKKQEWRDDGMYEIETWHKEDTFQANALVERKPADEGFTAKDLLEALGGWLQSEEALLAFRTHGIGVLRINDIRETPYENDRGQWQMSVSLPFTLTYKQTRERQIPVVSGEEFDLHRV